MPVAVYPWHQRQWQEILQRKAALPHALLFKGREGIGKLDFVRKLAQSLACESPAADGAGCGTCQSCRWFAAGNHPDCREMLPEAMRPAGVEKAIADGRKPRQEIIVDDVRDLEVFINLIANHRNGKTIVVYPAEALNVNAANALLKNLEEPPPSTRFMLVAHRPSYLPATIISRCQQVVLPTPPAAIAERWLGEQGMAEPALSLAQTGNAPLAALALDDAEFWTQRKALLGGLAASRVDPLALAEQIGEFPLGRLLGCLQRWTYDLLSAKSTGRVRYNPDFETALTRIAASLRAADIARFLRALVHQQRSVNHPLNPRLFIEQLLLSYAALLRGEDLAGVHAG
ncbi:MAG: DNA polymerase III subunit delta' [Betaproteobacteria bacterium]|nr:DNA polymerase III subunit delta' [Betaproteobacteria bacterium]